MFKSASDSEKLRKYQAFAGNLTLYILVITDVLLGAPKRLTPFANFLKFLGLIGTYLLLERVTKNSEGILPMDRLLQGSSSSL